MKQHSLIKYFILFFSLITGHCFSQADAFVKNDGIIFPVHKANIGKITFMKEPIEIENYKETDFIKTLELTKKTSLYLRAFMDNSLTNYLHQLQPELSAEQLDQLGNFQFSFYLDGALVYTENLNHGAFGLENKNSRTSFRIPLMTAKQVDSWGWFLWRRFLSNAEDGFTPGSHLLKIELRPYINYQSELKIGSLIAEGELNLIIPDQKTKAGDLRKAEIQSIQPNNDWEISDENYDKKIISDLNLKIIEKKFKKITSVVVIKNGKILIEEYFNGADRNTLHDTRSVGKSFISAIMGIAIEERKIKDENETLNVFYDLKKYENYSLSKETVTIKSLLTMSSGFNANDFDEQSIGNEEKMYPTKNWVQFALDLPMDSSKIVFKNWDYFTAGVVVLGDIANKSVPEGLYKYADEKLFKPLEIQNYKWSYTPQEVPNTGGGLKMKALDLAKFGQLYKNKGIWNQKLVLPNEWVEKTFTKYFEIPNRLNEFYGYLFWNKTYQVQDKTYETFYCAGNGGNKVFIFKDQPLVVIITSTAYNTNYMHAQSDKIMQSFILPAVSE